MPQGQVGRSVTCPTVSYRSGNRCHTHRDAVQAATGDTADDPERSPRIRARYAPRHGSEDVHEELEKRTLGCFTRTWGVHVRASPNVVGRSRHIQSPSGGAHKFGTGLPPSRDRDSIDGSTIDCIVKARRGCAGYRHWLCAEVGCPDSCTTVCLRVEAECAPFQYALSTRAGTDCVGHMLRAATDLDPNATILSVDGIGAYDHVSRAAMLGVWRQCPLFVESSRSCASAMRARPHTVGGMTTATDARSPEQKAASKATL